MYILFANQAYVNVDESESESRIFVNLEHYRSSKCIAYLHITACTVVQAVV